jgi:hypothetical protein
MPKQVMAYGNGGGISSLASVPMETTLAGQPHRLAYVNPQEEQMMLAAGGAGLPGPGGIPAYWNLFEPSTWGDGNGFEGFTSSSSSSTPSNDGGSSNNDSTPTFKSLSEASKAGYHGKAVNIEGKGLQKVEFADDSYNIQMSNASAAASSSNDSPGIIDSILMGIGAKDKTPGYNAATAAGIAARKAAEDAARLNPTAGDDDNVPVVSGGGGGGGGGGATPVVVEETVTPFTGLTDTQLGAQSEYLSNVATYLGQFDQNQLSDVGQRRSIYGSNEFKPTTEEFIAITGADEELAQTLIRSIPKNDLRDWSKIMASDNPLEAAQAATAAYYMTPGLYGGGQTIHTGQMVDAVDNLIAETDQLYAYSKGYSPFRERYGVGNVKIGIKTPDGVQLTELGPLSSPTFGENLARYGYGSEDLAELIPAIQQYYTDNFDFNPSYYNNLTKVSDGRYVGNGRNVMFGGGDAQTNELSQLLGQDVVVQQPNGTYSVMDTFGLGQGAISGENIDPFGYISNLQSYENPYTTSALDVGQGYLFQNTPGFYGQSALNIIDEDLYNDNQAAAAATAAAKAQADAIAQAQAAGISSGTPTVGSQQSTGVQSTGLQNYSALVPAAGTSTQGIAGLPMTPATNNPYVFTSYNPGTYNPVVGGGLMLPPLA